MTKERIIQIVLSFVVALATSLASIFGVQLLTSCESIDSISVGASVTFPHSNPTEFEQMITDPPEIDSPEEVSMGLYDYVDSGVNLYFSKFNLSYNKMTTLPIGYWVPFMARQVMPNDHLRIGIRASLKLNPTTAPFMTPIDGVCHYFFVPFSLLYGLRWGDKSDTFWQDIITGGDDGNNQDSLPIAANAALYDDVPGDPNKSGGPTNYITLANYFGYPTFNSNKITPKVVYPPTDTLHRAYWLVMRDYFMVEDLEDVSDDILPILRAQLALGGQPGDLSWSLRLPLAIRANKDYFTSALIDPLKGTPPAIPVDLNSQRVTFYDGVQYRELTGQANPSGNTHNVNLSATLPGSLSIPGVLMTTPTDGAQFGVDDTRTAFAVQRILERANRCGSRYTEYLQANFRTSPLDLVLRRPRYLGGVRFNVAVPEVLQQSESATTPQGTRAGAGFAYCSGHIPRLDVQEWGVVIGVMGILPRRQYFQGLNRQWRCRTRYDFFNPSMQNLSEQAIESGELYVDFSSNATLEQHQETWGYNGCFDFYRISQDEISGDMRTLHKDWVIAEEYSTRPNLNINSITPAFREINYMKNFFVKDEQPIMAFIHNSIKATRPMVRYPVPGLVDHS